MNSSVKVLRRPRDSGAGRGAQARRERRPGHLCERPQGRRGRRRPLGARPAGLRPEHCQLRLPDAGPPGQLPLLLILLGLGSVSRGSTGRLTAASLHEAAYGMPRSDGLGGRRRSARCSARWTRQTGRRSLGEMGWIWWRTFSPRRRTRARASSCTPRSVALADTVIHLC